MVERVPYEEFGLLQDNAEEFGIRLDRLPSIRRENVEVYGSHCGLGHNPAVLHVLADRLAQGDQSWRPFAPRALVRHAFP